MKCNSIFLRIALIATFMLITGCGGGGGGGAAGGLIVDSWIAGPDSVNENTDVQYTVTAKGDTGITYAWACDPASVGTWTNQQSATATFHAGFVTADTPVTIHITVNSDKDQPVVRNRNITVKDTGANELTVSPITGPEIIDEGATAAFSVLVTNGENVAYLWTTDPNDVGQLIQQGAAASYIAGYVTDDTPVTIKVVVMADNGDPKVRTKVFTIKNVSVTQSGWARTWGGSDEEYGNGVAVDGSGNVYVTGSFEGTVDFDTGNGVDNHISNGSYDIFLSKADSSGAFKWARTCGGSGEDWPVSVTVDVSGNVYVTGMFEETVDFDTGSGIDNHTAKGIQDVFLSKFDSSGNFKWARTWGGSSDDWGCSVAVDGSGNAYVGGDFCGTVDFDPGPGVDKYSSNGSKDNFLSKFDSSGNFLWACTWGGGGDDWGYSVAVDGSGNAYVTGFFYGTVDFDPGSGVDNHTSVGDEDIFLSKLDSLGNFKWARTWGGIGLDSGEHVAIDVSGNAYVGGDFIGTVDFDPGPGVDNHSQCNGCGIFLSKFDSSGNLNWARTWDGNGWDKYYPVAVDGSGNAYVTGWFQGTIDFDPGPSVDNHTSNGHYDICLSKFDSTGNFKWTRTLGGIEWDYGHGVAVDGLGNAYVTGCFSGTVDFDPGSGVDNHTSNGYCDVFLIKFLPNGNW